LDITPCFTHTSEERGKARHPLRVPGPTQVEEAPGWNSQGNGADGRKSVESASWVALRGAEKAHIAKERADQQKIFLRTEWTCAEFT